MSNESTNTPAQQPDPQQSSSRKAEVLAFIKTAQADAEKAVSQVDTTVQSAETTVNADVANVEAGSQAALVDVRAYAKGLTDREKAIQAFFHGFIEHLIKYETSWTYRMKCRLAGLWHFIATLPLRIIRFFK